MRDVEGLDFHREGGVATVRLNRPERLNALTWTMVEGLIDFTEECSRDETIRGMMITGIGRAFSSGDDIVEGMGEIPAGCVAWPVRHPCTTARHGQTHRRVT